MASAEPYSGQDGLRPAGTFISSVIGVRVATPFFGTGFNACIGALASGYQGQATSFFGTGFEACTGALAAPLPRS